MQSTLRYEKVIIVSKYFHNSWEKISLEALRFLQVVWSIGLTSKVKHRADTHLISTSVVFSFKNNVHGEYESSILYLNYCHITIPKLHFFSTCHSLHVRLKVAWYYSNCLSQWPVSKQLWVCFCCSNSWQPFPIISYYSLGLDLCHMGCCVVNELL